MLPDTNSYSVDSRPSDFNDGAEAILIDATLEAQRVGKSIHHSRSSTPQSHKDSCPGPEDIIDGQKGSWKHDDLSRKFRYLANEIGGVLEAVGRIEAAISKQGGILTETLLEQYVVLISIDAIQKYLGIDERGQRAGGTVQHTDQRNRQERPQGWWYRAAYRSKE
ncbi:hypothetical protein F4604DRAFT_1676530 [Suillus subluteus]|nr:hypothetical protein F4604DRAFT_1676530 [Suillus subluteus]